MNKIEIRAFDVDGDVCAGGYVWTNRDLDEAIKAARNAIWSLNYNHEQPLTLEFHRYRHKQLHQYFDELLADWITHTDGSISAPITAIMDWSAEQRQHPTEQKPGESKRRPENTVVRDEIAELRKTLPEKVVASWTGVPVTELPREDLEVLLLHVARGEKLDFKLSPEGGVP